uniref:hypothetical protein n=1 Tax=Bacteroides acidifaciens TaxID=85831 RepID=UPI00242D6281
MKTKKQKETNEKEVHLLEQKGYERMVNEIVPMQQVEACHNPTKVIILFSATTILSAVFQPI